MEDLVVLRKDGLDDDIVVVKDCVEGVHINSKHMLRDDIILGNLIKYIRTHTQKHTQLIAVDLSNILLIQY